VEGVISEEGGGKQRVENCSASGDGKKREWGGGQWLLIRRKGQKTDPDILEEKLDSGHFVMGRFAGTYNLGLGEGYGGHEVIPIGQKRQKLALLVW